MTFADPDRFLTAKPLHRCDESDLLRAENAKLRAALGDLCRAMDGGGFTDAAIARAIADNGEADLGEPMTSLRRARAVLMSQP